MSRQKQRPRKIVARKNSTSVPNSDFSSPISSPAPAAVPETPQKQDTPHALNGNLHVPCVPPSSPLSSSLPTSPATPSVAGVKVENATVQDDATDLRFSPPLERAPIRTGGSDESDVSDTPRARQRRSKRSPASAKEDQFTGYIGIDTAVDDAASSTSSKRKYSPAMDDSQENPTTTNRPKRLRPLPQESTNTPIKLHDEDFQPPYTPLTSTERSAWKGWVEIESEPVHVNAMLRDLGVRGVRAQEVFSLDPDDTSKLEQPVYGLIFLFQYQDSDHIAQGEECPKDIWFSNQLPATYSCATVALLNALMNSQGVELGKPLSFFKEDTMELTPMERAHCVNEHEFIRGVHNSFANRVDMWNADRIFAAKYKKAMQAHEKRLRDEERERVKAERAAKAKEGALNNPSKATTNGGSKRSKRPQKKKRDKYCDDTSSGDDAEPDSSAATKSTYDDESGYHYVAYLPLNGHVWRMDGMSAHPQDLGEISDSAPWLEQAGEHIQARMLEFDGAGILFNLMALVKDPVEKHREELARCVNTLVEVEKRLDAQQEGWREFAEELGDEVLRGADEEMGLTASHLSSVVQALTSTSSSSTPTKKLFLQRTELARDQESLKEMIRIQNVKVANETLNVAKDRLDLNPMIHQVLLDLEENGAVQELMSRFKD